MSRKPPSHLGIECAVISLLLLSTTLWAGCATHREDPEQTGQVLYYDRNEDGRVDLETHHFPGWSDADWELRDDDYDGWYEKKIVFGVAVKEAPVHLPVPKSVHIEPKP